MKSILKVFAVIFVMLLTGCKNENSGKPEGNVSQEVKNNFFKVTTNMIVPKDDNFQIYYTESPSEPFTEEKSFWVPVKGGSAAQDIVFNFPDDIVPSLIRLDFGTSDAQEDITFKSVEMQFFDKKFRSEGPGLAVYFRPLELTEIDFTTGVIKAVKKDGKRIEPVLYPHEVPLGEEIKKITN